MSMFQHDAKQFKFDVLREVAKRCYDGILTDNTPDELAHLLPETTTVTNFSVITVLPLPNARRSMVKRGLFRAKMATL